MPEWELIDGARFNQLADTAEIAYSSDPDNGDDDDVYECPESIEDYVNTIGNSTYDYNWRSNANPDEVKDDAPRILSDVEMLYDFHYKGHILGSGEKVEFHLKKGKTLAGSGLIKITFDAQKSPKNTLIPFGYSSIEGYFDGTGFNGAVILETSDNRFLVSKAKDNVLHGSAILHGVKPVIPVAKEYTFQDLYFNNSIVSVSQGLGFLGTFYNGVLTGTVWMGAVGNAGFFHGKLDSQGKFTGKWIIVLLGHIVKCESLKFEVLSPEQNFSKLHKTCSNSVIYHCFSAGYVSVSNSSDLSRSVRGCTLQP